MGESRPDVAITGGTATEIADSVRSLVDRGELTGGDPLPPVRALAEMLGVNRNTVMAAYRQLTGAGVLVTKGRGGTRVADRLPVAQEGYARDSVLRDIGTGNPDPALIPDPGAALVRLAGRPVLYGEPVIDPELEEWATAWTAADLPAGIPLRITVTSGAADAVERLLAQALTRDDAVGLEDPCFLASIHTVQLAGYRPVAIPVDDEGMTVDGVRAALADGIRALVCTPRAQNPTGASMSARRAAELRAVLDEHPYVLVIEDDHFAMLSQRPFHSLIEHGRRRWALVRSVSKSLGPDMCLAVTASDPHTAERLAMRLTPGTTWVSHLLQRLVVSLATDDAVREQIARAAAHYAQRNTAFADRLTAQGLPAHAGDGLNLWVRTPAPAREVTARLMRRGWLARAGDEFVLADTGAAHHLRLTVHDLDEAAAQQLAVDLAAAAHAASRDEMG